MENTLKIYQTTEETAKSTNRFGFRISFVILFVWLISMAAVFFTTDLYKIFDLTSGIVFGVLIILILGLNRYYFEKYAWKKDIMKFELTDSKITWYRYPSNLVKGVMLFKNIKEISRTTLTNQTVLKDTSSTFLSWIEIPQKWDKHDELIADIKNRMDHCNNSILS